MPASLAAGQKRSGGRWAKVLGGVLTACALLAVPALALSLTDLGTFLSFPAVVEDLRDDDSAAGDSLATPHRRPGLDDTDIVLNDWTFTALRHKKDPDTGKGKGKNTDKTKTRSHHKHHNTDNQGGNGGGNQGGNGGGNQGGNDGGNQGNQGNQK
jgi:hypothetical protein